MYIADKFFNEPKSTGCVGSLEKGIPDFDN